MLENKHSFKSDKQNFLNQFASTTQDTQNTERFGQTTSRLESIKHLAE
jgi:hypothetical protein